MEKIFKAKRLDNGEWHEFLLEEINPTMLENINADTICQYTGIEDKDGNRIFEGDEVKGYKYEANKPYIVRYFASKYNCGFVASDNKECNPHIHPWYEGLILTGHNTHDKGE